MFGENIAKPPPPSFSNIIGFIPALTAYIPAEYAAGPQPIIDNSISIYKPNRVLMILN